MVKFLAVLVLMLAVNSAFGFWSACKVRSGTPSPISLFSPQCNATSCTVTRGGRLTARAEFAATHSHSLLTTIYIAHPLGLPVTLPINPLFNNACGHLENASCPTTVGVRYVWNLNFEVLLSVPLMVNVPIESML